MALRSEILNLGTETALHVLAQASKMRAEGRNIAMLCVGQPDFTPAEHILEAGAKASRDGPHGYTNATGLPVLRQALAEYHSKQVGRSLDPERFIVTPGGKPTAWMALLMFGEPKSEIIVPDPFFPVYRNGVNFTQAQAAVLPLREEDNFELTADSLAEKITPQTRLVLINTPSNPTGSVISKSECDRIAELILSHDDLYLLADEIYDRIIFDGYSHHSFLSYPELDERLIYLNGFSKAYAMTGWRVGYGYWPEPLVEYASRLAVNEHSCVNGPSQMAALAALTGPQDQIAEMSQAFQRRAEKACTALRALPGVTCTPANGAFYLFPRVAIDGYNSSQLSQALLKEEGLAISPGTSFGTHGEGYIRFSVAAADEELLDGVARLGNFLSNFQQGNG